MSESSAFEKSKFREHMMKKRLIEMRLTVREASEQIGISPATISRIENDKTISLEAFCKCLKWLQTSSCNYFQDIPTARDSGHKFN